MNTKTKWSRRLLAVLLALSMVMSSFSTLAYADDTVVTETNAAEEVAPATEATPTETQAEETPAEGTEPAADPAEVAEPAADPAEVAEPAADPADVAEPAAEPAADAATPAEETALDELEAAANQTAEEQTPEQTEEQAEPAAQSEEEEVADVEDAQTSNAAGDLTVTVGSDGGDVSLSSGTSDHVDWSSDVAMTANNYNMKAIVDVPQQATDISLSLSLGEGVIWIDDGSGTKQILDALNGGAAGITKTALGPYFNNGSQGGTIYYNKADSGLRTYSITNETAHLEMDLALSYDLQFNYDSLPGAGATANEKTPVTATLTYMLDGNKVTETRTLDTATLQRKLCGTWNRITGLAATPPNYNLGTITLAPGETIDYATKLDDNFKALNPARPNAGGVPYGLGAMVEKIEIQADFDSTYQMTPAMTATGWTGSGSNNSYTYTWVPTKLADSYIGLAGLSVTAATGIPEGTIIPSTWKTTFTYYGGKTETSTLKYDFKIIPDDERVFVGATSTIMAASRPEKTAFAFTEVANTATFMPGTQDGIVGRFYIGNYGAKDSQEKTIEMHFDTSAIGVTGMTLQVGPGAVVTSVSYQTDAQADGDDSWTTVPVTIPAGTKLGLSYLTRVSLGIPDGEYIKAIKYNVPTIPSNFMFGIPESTNPHNSIIGVVKQSGVTYKNTIQIYDADGLGVHDTGVGTYTNTPSNLTTLSQSAVTTPQIKNAGETFKFSWNISDTYWSRTNLQAPIYYLKSEANIPFTNIHLTNVSKTNTEITAADGLKIYNTTIDGSLYTVVDTRGVQNQQLVQIGAHTEGTEVVYESLLVLRADIETSETTPSGTYENTKILNFVTPYQELAFTGVINTLNDPTTGESWRAIELASPNITRNAYYQIVGREDITVTSEAKSSRAPDSAYAVPNEAHPILMSNSATSGSDIKIIITNNGASKVTNQSTVYFPILKEGDDWKTLVTKQEFPLALKGPVNDVDNSHFVIEYGIDVEPSDIYSDLDAQATQFTQTLPEGKTWNDVNCIKITTTEMEAKTAYDFIFSANVEGSSVGDSMKDAWEPLYYQNTGKVVGIYHGSTIYAETAFGELQGELFKDVSSPLDGIKNNAEGLPDNVTNYKLQIRLTENGNLVQEISPETDGTFHFYDLWQDNSGAKYYLQVVNPDSANTMFTITATQNDSNVANQIVGSGDHSTGRTAGAIKTFISTDLSKVNGTYNVGVADKVNTTITFKASDTLGTKGTAAASTYGTVNGTDNTATAQGLYTDALTAPTPVAATGYAFDKWVDDAGNTVTAAQMGNAGKFGTTAKTYWAVFKAADVNYTIKSYLLDVNGVAGTGAYSEKKSVEKQAKTGASISIDDAKTNSGYTVPDYATFRSAAPTTQGATTVAADGSTVIELYYDLKNYTVTWTSGANGTITNTNDPATESVQYGSKPKYDVTANPSTGYGFLNWDYADKDGTAQSNSNYKNVEIYKDTTFNATFAKLPYLNGTVEGGNGVVTAGNGDSITVATGATTSSTHEYDLGVTEYTGSVAFQAAANYAVDTIVVHTPQEDTDANKTLALDTGAAQDVITGQLTATYDAANNRVVIKDIDNAKGISAKVVITFKALTYEVKYDANTGTGTAMTNSTFNYGQDSTLKKNTYTKQGFTFLGWNETANATTATYADELATFKKDSGDASVKDGVVTLYAIWGASTDTAYKVEHYKQNVDGTYPTAASETEDKTGTTNATATAVAKTYTGFTENTTHADRVPTGTIAADGSLVLKLYYARDTYTVTYDVQGKGTAPAQQTGILYEATTTKPAPDPTADGYTFGGWYKEQTCGIAWNFTSDKVTSSITLYAKWTPKADTAYKVEHYKQNVDGTYPTAASETEDKTGTTNATATAVAKTYTGFAEDTAHADRVPSGTIAGDGSLVLKLYYARNKYTVTYDKNGHGTAAPAAVNNVLFGASLTAPTDTTGMAEAGYTWDTKWYTTKECTTEWNFATDTMPNNAITLFAKWTENANITIEYVSADATMGSVDPASESLAPATGVAKGSTAKANAGYHFVNWTDATGKEVSTDAAYIPAKVEGLNVAAKYTANFAENDNVTLTYVTADAVKGTVAPADESVAPATGAAKGSTATAKPGYKFVNWTVNGVEVSKNETITAAEVDKAAKATGIYVATTFTANFTEKDNVVIRYVSEDNAIGTASPASDSVAPATGTVKGSTATPKPGYHFVNWTNDVDKTTTTAAVLTAAQVNAVAKASGIYVATTFTAHFAEDDDVTIKYVSASAAMGSVTPADETLAPATGVAKGSAATANAGYHFVNWTDAKGTVVSTNAAYIPAKVGGLNVAATYTANFAENDKITITYQSESEARGSVAPKSESVAPATGAAIGSTATPATGYSFKNWTSGDKAIATEPTVGASAEFNAEATEAVPAGTVVSTNATITPAEVNAVAKASGIYETTVFTAHFDAITYTIHYNGNTGAGSMADETFTFDNLDQKLTANSFTKENYYFAGWNTKADGSGISVSDQGAVSNITAGIEGTAVTVYAQWSRSNPVIDNPTVVKNVSGKPNAPARFEFTITANSPVNPMPEGSAGTSKMVAITGTGAVAFGSITFTDVGTYVYTVKETNLGDNQYYYDETVYTVTYVITAEGTGLRSACTMIANCSTTHPYVASVTNQSRDALIFNNIYEDSGHGDIGPANENGTWGKDDNTSGNAGGNGNAAFGGYTSAAEQSAAIAAGKPAIKGDYTYGGYGSASAQAAAIAAGKPAVKAATTIPQTSDNAPLNTMYLLLILAAAALVVLAVLKKRNYEQL